MKTIIKQQLFKNNVYVTKIPFSVCFVYRIERD